MRTRLEVLWSFVCLITLGVLAASSPIAIAQVHVRGYHRKDGTYVKPHLRSAPDGDFSNNWSTKGNTNPHTGKPGTKTAPRSNYRSLARPRSISSPGDAYGEPKLTVPGSPLNGTKPLTYKPAGDDFSQTVETTETGRISAANPTTAQDLLVLGVRLGMTRAEVERRLSHHSHIRVLPHWGAHDQPRRLDTNIGVSFWWGASEDRLSKIILSTFGTDTVAESVPTNARAKDTDWRAKWAAEEAAEKAAEKQALDTFVATVRTRWRSLRRGMTASQARQILGEPEKITAYSSSETWNYDKFGTISIDKHGHISRWKEPEYTFYAFRDIPSGTISAQVESPTPVSSGRVNDDRNLVYNPPVRHTMRPRANTGQSLWSRIQSWRKRPLWPPRFPW